MTELATLGLSVRSDGVVVATDRLREFEGAGRRAEGIAGSLVRTALGLGAALAGAFSVRAITQYADAWSDMQSRVGAAVKDMDAAPALMQRIVDLANASYSPLEQTVEIYSRNVAVLRDLGVSAAGAADFTESLNHMLVITATRGERAASVQNALSKAMAVGRLQADGLETVLANGGRVAEALADELGTTVSGLRGMASQGKITGDVIANALLNSLEDVRVEAGDMEATIGDAFVRIQNNTMALIGTLDKAWGISASVSGSLLGMADNIRGSADTLFRLGNIVGSVVGPAFDLLSANMDTIASLAGIAVVAMAGFFAPTMIAGLASLATALAVGVAGGIKAVTLAMLANPLGLLIGGIAAAVTAAFVFRDEIKQIFGVDVIDVMEGVANGTIGLFVGAYEAIIAGWDLLPAAFADIFTMAMNGAIDIVQSGVNGIIGALRSIPGLDGLEDADLSGFKGQTSGGAGELATVVSEAFAGAQGNYIGDFSTALGETWANAEGALGALTGLTDTLGDEGGLNGALKAANDNLAPFEKMLGEMGHLLEQARDPFQQLQYEMDTLGALLNSGQISWEQYGEAAQRAHLLAASSTLGAVGQISGALSQLFQNNKGFAVANALINTAEGVTKALAQGGIFGFVGAAAVAASGAAQVAAIMSAQPGSSGKPSVGASAPAIQQQPSARSVNINLQGDNFSASSVGNLFERLNEELGIDGLELVVNHKQA